MAELEPPRFVDGKPLLIVGVSKRYNRDELMGPHGNDLIPGQWQRFLPHLGKVPGQVGGVAYGVGYNGDEIGNFDYLCGVEVADFAQLTPEWSRLSLSKQRYAIFTHRGPISGIRATWGAIYQWLPTSGHARARAPDFERYDEKFDARSDSGFV
jgi:AraC family transcriptional regulator